MGPVKNFDLLFVVFILGLVAATAIPLYKSFGLVVLAILGVIIGGYALLVLLLNIAGIFDWVRRKSHSQGVGQGDDRHDV